VPVGHSTGPALKRRREARANLDEAIRTQTAIYGYEAEPNPAALERGERAIKHFYLDRVHRLRPIIGLTLARPQEQLAVDAAFRERFGANGAASFDDSILFELTEPSGHPSGAAPAQPAGGEPNPNSLSESQGDNGEDLMGGDE